MIGEGLSLISPMVIRGIEGFVFAIVGEERCAYFVLLIFHHWSLLFSFKFVLRDRFSQGWQGLLAGTVKSSLG